ncbi:MULTISPECIES: helix-turn-helix domain-containing protein [Rodentibacter]|uniref:helix-turn-helix domain-containing protein n=1 Tax=Rodentibacter TaxID=1960084 RepID=UPI001CFE72EA|nr:helix-turn-helix domain-containing protein [Rodentibacter sp. JRC1]GJI55884.1 hypothetical protein HEMROJRC1_09960 [Rodentibacter sp. JRC1]
MPRYNVKFDAEKIINRMRQIFHAETNKELSIHLNISDKTISGWKAKGVIPLDKLLETVWRTDCGLDWLVYGIDEKNQIPLNEMEIELLKRFKQLDFSQKLQVFNSMEQSSNTSLQQTIGNNSHHIAQVGQNLIQK